LLFGQLFGWALYGALCVQVYIYHLCFNDQKKLRILVYSVFLLDTLQTVLSAVDAHYWFGSGFGNVLRLANPYFSAFDSPLMDGVISLVVQWYFCYRIWLLSNKSWYLPAFIGAVAVMQAACAIASGVRGHEAGNFDATHDVANLTLVYIWLIGSLLADVLIAASMIYLLLKAKSEISSTNLLLAKLVRLVLETNLLTAIVALLTLVLHVTLPDKAYFSCLVLFLGKLYSNTFMVTLNNRVFIGRSSSSQVSDTSETRLPRFRVRTGGHAMQLDTFTAYNEDDASPSQSKYKTQSTLSTL